jgi:hypothetical protein
MEEFLLRNRYVILILAGTVKNKNYDLLGNSAECSMYEAEFLPSHLLQYGFFFY